jgi:glycosyltransferase involved in cell wall biosynthesis
MRRLKIVHIIWNTGIGGLEELVLDIANEQSHDAQVWIIVINGRPSESVSDRLNPAVKLVSLGRQRSSRVPWAFLRLNWIVQRIRPDIIHAHHWNHRKLLLSPPGKSVLTVHATRESDVFDNSTRRYQRVFAVSKAVADDIRMHRTDLQPIVVRNGVNCSELRCQPWVPADLFRIVEIARLDHDIKGQDILLRAVAQIHKQPGGGAVRLDLIGEGPSRPYLENLARELGIDAVVSFRGVIPRFRMYGELCEYDLLVQASRYEGFGLAIVEGMAAGIPVLVSDLEGPREIVANGQFGFLFRPEDDADCAKQIEHIREMIRTKRLAGLLVAAKAHAMEQFDVKRTAKEY